MNGQPDEHYLRLALQRKVDETRLNASNAATAIFRKANAVGALNSGSTLSAINEKMKSLYTTQIESMSQFTRPESSIAFVLICSQSMESSLLW